MSKIHVHSETDFRQIPRLRLRQEEDGSAVAVSNRTKLLRDFLCFHGPGKLALYYFRKTEKAGTSAHRWWRDRLPANQVLEEMRGHGEGWIIFRLCRLADIPAPFLRRQLSDAERIARRESLARARARLEPSGRATNPGQNRRSAPCPTDVSRGRPGGQNPARSGAFQRPPGA